MQTQTQAVTAVMMFLLVIRVAKGQAITTVMTFCTSDPFIYSGAPITANVSYW